MSGCCLWYWRDSLKNTSEKLVKSFHILLTSFPNRWDIKSMVKSTHYQKFTGQRYELFFLYLITVFSILKSLYLNFGRQNCFSKKKLTCLDCVIDKIKKVLHSLKCSIFKILQFWIIMIVFCKTVGIYYMRYSCARVFVMKQNDSIIL